MYSDKELAKKKAASKKRANPPPIPVPRPPGRPMGSSNKRTLAAQENAERTGITPLEFMLRNMREPIPEDATTAERVVMQSMRQQAARDAAPYIHARLSSVHLSGEVKLTHESALDELE